MGIYFRNNSHAKRSYTHGSSVAGRLSRKSSRGSGFPWIVAFFFVLVALLIVGTIVYSIAWQFAKNTVTDCTVEDKDRTTTQDGSSDMRIYTDCGVYQVGDNFWTGTFSSADTYASIEVGETYDFYTVGWRFPLLSHFPLILEVTPSGGQ